jgi:hypothetical protein
MSIKNSRDINPLLVNQENYNLAIRHMSTYTSIQMSLLTPYYHTTYLPNTYKTLKTLLPSVLKTECFNDSGLPFDTEVKNTEIGHLFEHILLEYLCQLKIKGGHKRASFRGVTNWNWKRDARGTFHISIDISPKDVIYLDIAMEKSIVLLNKILAHRELGIN